MLGFFRTLLIRFGIVRDSRAIFSYWDGQRQRSIDPLVAWRKIWSHDGCNLASDAEISRDPKDENGTPLHAAADVYAAEDRIRALIRDVFGITQWSEEVAGLTAGEIDDLLGKFMLYIADLKKKRNPSPTPPPPTASTPPQDSSGSGDAFPTNTPSDLSSSANESSDDEPIGSWPPFVAS